MRPAAVWAASLLAVVVCTLAVLAAWRSIYVESEADQQQKGTVLASSSPSLHSAADNPHSGFLTAKGPAAPLTVLEDSIPRQRSPQFSGGGVELKDLCVRQPIRPPPDVGNVFIALNLKNVAHAGLRIGFELARLAAAIGTDKVYVSIYESGSQDSTPQVLAFISSALAELNVKHSIVSNATDTKPANAARIPFLVRMRNQALAPMHTVKDSMPGQTFHRVIFINDVLFCASDVAMAMWTKDVSMVCGMDFVLEDSKYAFSGVMFYDVWVGRDRTGRMMHNVEHFLTDAVSWESMAHNEPTPVYCCWNGVVIIDARIFLEEGIKFRDPNKDECSASECSLFCRDIWKAGRGRVVVDPRLRVAYEATVFRRLLTDVTPLPTLSPTDPAFSLHYTADNLTVPFPSHEPHNVTCCPADSSKGCYREPTDRTPQKGPWLPSS